MPTNALQKFTKKYDEYPDDIFADTRMSLGDHIEELRYRMLNAIKCLLAFMVIGFMLDFVGWTIGNRNLGIGMPMLDVITEPVKQQTRDFYYRKALKDADAKLAQLTDSPPEEIARIRQKLKDNENSLEALNADERLKLLGAPEEMPVFIPTSALEPAFGPRKKEAPDELAVKLRVYPAHITSLSSKGEGLLESKNYLTTLSAQESMVVYFKVSILCGIVLSCPFIFYQFWAFVGAGLYPHEKRYVYLFFGPSVGLFLAGVLLCQFIVLPGTVKALLRFNEILGFDPDIRLNEWLGLALILPLVFGVSFQTPLLMVFLNRIGIFTAQDYLTKWRYACIIIAFFAALLTPTPDVITMLYLFVPMFGLYMGGILVCHMFPGFKPDEDSESDPTDEVAV
ncbi:Sec-independent protein translocase protein TatCy [Gemmata obscuriglobus]|uniref:Sec-independent protein translocase protein TatC n=1 Tax=Gemmata obscuriglobus TaxID=114 RepID=A0A2Z3GXB7_9BACT|nr:twin-arginine translocase subunit TatC [Gemmata obscuriglobus]AWM38038.1 twin-arginine translocase subunit TatC [Gemmata obscuriglobus]QEG29093.1 Sec-independent protein translocase protein TatCy [Gemmata obscuriglobus]VTS07761.1 sec-independent protein subunit : Sec-independent protein translocase protein TatC OS=Singulisphaera acidiphila (strain ATCC BAA-1392 / DSM 18658 / VKM B-2454 / MOB10) GN=tatC PE=3 SV=1: TatC [Gemmata obscuriglobus UQM 2246]